ncbi:MAG: DUF4332 domain-containing protein [Gemmatimonadota bacterium]|nr:DUF4332 domain-containing protein [Gemmatimonadota bacterium]
MTYKIEQIEGIGVHFAERLAAVGIHTSDDLMARCETMDGRAQLAATTDLPASMLLTWANQADLMRVNGIGTGFGQLLESSGIQSVTELSERKPENVVQLLDIVNEEKQLTRVVPPLKTVKRWVERARRMTGVGSPRMATVPSGQLASLLGARIASPPVIEVIAMRQV